MAAAPHHAGRWLLLLLLAVLAASPAAAADEQPGPSSSTAADASRLSLPGHPKLTLVYPLAGLRTPPTPNPAYGAPASPAHPMSNASVAFAGGRGWLVITRHEMSAAPGGVLSEAMFFPGQYVPLRCAPPGWTAAQPRPRYHSTARFWVDWSVSRDYGRNVWGFPKVRVWVNEGAAGRRTSVLTCTRLRMLAVAAFPPGCCCRRHHHRRWHHLSGPTRL